MEDLSQTYHAIKELLHPKALKEKDLMSHDNPINLSADKSYPIALDEVTFSFGLGAVMNVQLFNDEDDKDDNAFVAAKDAPILLNTATDAYLKYATTVTAKANGQVSLADIGFNLNLSAAGSAKAIYYKKHPNTQLVREAFQEDIKQLRTIFKWEDVAGLEENNGLGFLSSGTMSCSLSVSWSNILATGFTTLSNVLTLPLTLDVSLTPNLTAQFSVTITDDFGYLLKKQANNQYLISVSKKNTSTVSASLGATIGVQFADPTTMGQQVGAIADKIVQSVLGNTIAEINTAVENFKAGDKSPIVEKLFNLFNLSKLPQPIDLLAPQLQKLYADISAAVTKLATDSVSLSLTYQYNRIEAKQELLSGVINGPDLQNYHKDLLRLKTGKLIDDIRETRVPFTLLSYLNQKTLTISKSWGLGLTLFDLTLLTSKNYSEAKDTVLTDLKGTSNKIQLDRTNGYKWTLAKGSGSWMGQVSAAMPAFSLTPTLDLFGYTLLFNTVLSDPKMSESDFRNYLDTAAVWGAINAGDADKLIQKYADAKGAAVLVEGKLLFPDNVMRAVIRQIAADGWGTASKKQLARSMAAAMPWLSGYSLRADPQVRQDTYASLWANYLDDPDQSTDDFAALAQSEIQGMDDADHLAEFEANPANWTFGYSFAGAIRSNPGLQDRFKDFITGAADLQNKIQQHARYTDFNKSYSLLSSVFEDSFPLFAAGRFLLLYATELNLTKDIRKVLTITYGPDNKTTVINCSVV